MDPFDGRCGVIFLLPVSPSIFRLVAPMAARLRVVDTRTETSIYFVALETEPESNCRLAPANVIDKSTDQTTKTFKYTRQATKKTHHPPRDVSHSTKVYQPQGISIFNVWGIPVRLLVRNVHAALALLQYLVWFLSCQRPEVVRQLNYGTGTYQLGSISGSVPCDTAIRGASTQQRRLREIN